MDSSESDLSEENKKTTIKNDILDLGPEAQRIKDEVNKVIENIENKQKIHLLENKIIQLKSKLKEKNKIINNLKFKK